MTRIRSAVLIALLAGMAAALPLLAAPDQGTPPQNTGVDLTGLSPDQAAAATQILNETRCNCGCGMTLAECRVKDPNCGRSLTLSQQVVQDLKSGKDRATVQSNLQASLARLATPPPSPSAPQEDPNKVYSINIGESPVKGPKGAPVTLVEFSDYQ